MFGYFWLVFLVIQQQVTAVTVIPAIKGSREKHGKSLEKLSVSWAEDVYDPPPSIVSHTRSKKQQQHQKSKSSLKKSGKKGHKGSSSSSSSSRGSKDKKSSSSSSRSKHSRDKFGWATQMPIAAASSWIVYSMTISTLLCLLSLSLSLSHSLSLLFIYI